MFIDVEGPLNKDSYIILGDDGLHHGYKNLILKNDLEQFLANDDQIQNGGFDTFNIYKPYIGEVCVVKSDGSFYRSVFLGKDGQSIMMYSIDFGCVFQCAESDIRVSVSWFHVLPKSQ